MITVEELEAISGVTKYTISMLEQFKEGNPGYETVVKLEKALGLPRGALVFGDDAKRVYRNRMMPTWEVMTDEQFAALEAASL